MDKAVHYLALTGEKSLRVYAVEDAHRSFQRAAELLESIPDRVDNSFLADLVVAWARAYYYYRKDFNGLIGLTRYLPQVEALGDGRRLSLLLFWLGFALVFPARADEAKLLLERALAIGEALGDEECIGYASMGLMFLYELKPFDKPRSIVAEFGYRGLEIGERLTDVYLTPKCLLGLSVHDLFDGKYQEARDFALRMLDVGRRAGDPRAVAMGLNSLAIVNIYDERFTEAVKNAEEALHVSPDPLDRAVARGYRGLGLAFMGQTAEGVAVARGAIEDLNAGAARSLA